MIRNMICWMIRRMIRRMIHKMIRKMIHKMIRKMIIKVLFQNPPLRPLPNSPNLPKNILFIISYYILLKLFLFLEWLLS